MTRVLRRATWDQAYKELARDRSPLITKVVLGTITPSERAQLKVIHRELNWYEMKIWEPGLDRLERIARERLKVARQLTRAVRKLQEAAAEGSSQAGAA